MVGVVLLMGASELRCDLKASSTVEPEAETGFGEDRESTSLRKNACGSFCDISAQPSWSKAGSMG